MTQKLLEWLFTGIYFIICYYVIDWCFRQVPVNFLFDILAIVLMIIGFVCSSVLAYKTVQKIKETI